MAKILIKYEDSPRHDARVHPFQNIESGAVQIAIDIRKGQWLVVTFFVVAFQRFQERRDCVNKQSFMKRNLSFNVRDGSSSGIRAGRLVAPSLRNASEGVEACNER